MITSFKAEGAKLSSTEPLYYSVERNHLMNLLDVAVSALLQDEDNSCLEQTYYYPFVAVLAQSPPREPL